MSNLILFWGGKYPFSYLLGTNCCLIARAVRVKGIRVSRHRGADLNANSIKYSRGLKAISIRIIGGLQTSVSEVIPQ